MHTEVTVAVAVPLLIFYVIGLLKFTQAHLSRRYRQDDDADGSARGALFPPAIELVQASLVLDIAAIVDRTAAFHDRSAQLILPGALILLHLQAYLFATVVSRGRGPTLERRHFLELAIGLGALFTNAMTIQALLEARVI